MANKIVYQQTSFAGFPASAGNVKYANSNVKETLDILVSNMGTWFDINIPAGETEVTIESDKFTADCVIDIYYSNSTIGVTENAEIGKLTISLDSALDYDLNIKCKVVNP